MSELSLHDTAPPSHIDAAVTPVDKDSKVANETVDLGRHRMSIERMVGVLAIELKKQFDTGLQGVSGRDERAYRRLALREQSARKVLRIFRVVDIPVAEDGQAAHDRGIAGFARGYIEAEDLSQSSDNHQQLMELWDQYEDTPAIRTIDGFAKASQYHDDATYMKRAMLFIIGGIVNTAPLPKASAE